jgi:hypothetical protein
MPDLLHLYLLADLLTGMATPGPVSIHEIATIAVSMPEQAQRAQEARAGGTKAQPDPVLRR